MIKDVSKKRKQDLGIFYTPQEVANFVFDILNIYKVSQNKRWLGKYPSVMDPAVGEGGFLKIAVSKGFTKPDWVFGMDIDENAVKMWKEINLLKAFGGKKEDLEAHFFHQNGLEKIHWDQHKKKYYGKLKKEDINNEQFDCVVGNPPYGGIGIGELDNELEKSLFNFPIWKLAFRKNGNALSEQMGFLGEVIQNKEKDKLLKFPIETLFLDRFIQLAKPGGWIAIIIPDGILTNSNSHYVREFLSKKAKVEAIVSLPRETFKGAGTSAKTSILFLKKLNKNEITKKIYPVFLASVEKINQPIFNEIVKLYEKFYNSGARYMDKPNLIQITTDQNKRGIVMVRVDKSLRDLMEEKPSSRWNPGYWNPIYEENLNNIKLSKFKIQALGDFILEGTEGLTYGQVGSRVLSKNGTVQYLQVINITPTGIDILIRNDKVDENSNNDPQRSRLRIGDLLFVNQGVGSLGKTTVFLLDGKYNISQHIDVIRFENISPFYVCIYLQSKMGVLQIERFNSGVSGQINITFDQIKSILIPTIPEKVQVNIENEYKKIYKAHQKAIISQTKTKDIKIAEDMLGDLIKKTEEVIEGKRDNVN